MREGAATVTDFAPSETDPSIILHVDCDCFYAACERLRRPHLADEPVVIGMGYEQADPHGAVATASYEAREYGVESAMAISDALERLPRRVDADADDPAAPDPADAGYYLPVEMDHYQAVGGDVHALLEEYANPLEPVSIDEAYLDVTDATTWADVDAFARRLKTEIKTTVGIPVSIGVAPTKSAAKVASDHEKPDGLVVVRPGDVEEFFAPLDIESVHGIGPVTAGKLRERGIDTAGELATADPETLVNAVGSKGRAIQQRARGHDPRPVTPPDDPKSISKETSLDPEGVTDSTVKTEIVRELAGQVTTRASSKNALYRTVGIKVVQPPFDVNTRERSLSGPVQNEALVETVALDLLGEFETVPVRKLGVRVSNLSFSEREQAPLTEWEPADAASSSTALPEHIRRRLSEQRDQQATLDEFW
jgi:DNA polymerase IV (DinB-like DNA polymerase)